MTPIRKASSDPGSAEVAARPAKVWALSDLALLAELPFLLLIAGSSPGWGWRSYGRVRSALHLFLRPAAARALARRVQLVDLDPVGSTAPPGSTALPGSTAPPIVRQNRATSYENKLQVLRSSLFTGWRPTIRAEGFERLHEGLRDGNGVVLWVSDFAFHRLVLKMAFHDAGFEVSHLSGPKHGWSSTHFGRRTFNRIPISVEARFLRERVVMSDLDLPTEHRVVAAMRALRRRLGENGIVSVSALTSDWGPERVDFFRGRIRLAGGPPALAYASGAPLLPVFAVRETDGSYRITVEKALTVDTSQPRKAAVRGAVEAYIDLLARYVARYPGQWLGWRFLEAREPDPPQGGLLDQ